MAGVGLPPPTVSRWRPPALGNQPEPMAVGRCTAAPLCCWLFSACFLLLLSATDVADRRRPLLLTGGARCCSWQSACLSFP